MHGRLKVRTTAEQAEIKRKEREKKALAFTGGMKEVFKNRYIEDKQDSNLKITEKLLSGNPDVSTLWNIRKEIFLKMIDVSGDIDELLRNELIFLQNCLYVNPKSYGVWNQRMFVLEHMVNPNWNEELHLCNLFLKHDERNFHCWDYRRFVVKKSNVSEKDELNFSIEKIKENFSNYSAWHYRSKLLPSIYPDDSSAGHVQEDILLKEFELAQNAFFTDPNDQSAWFYQRWLLGRKETPPRIISLSIQRNPGKVALAFSKPVNLYKKGFEFQCLINEQVWNTNWKTFENHTEPGVNNTHSAIWILEQSFDNIPINISVNMTINENGCEFKMLLSETQSFESINWCNGKLPMSDEFLFQDSHTAAKSSILIDELEACKLLLEEEPDNKWTMLTIVYIMHALDMLKYENEIMEFISKLITIDSLRSGYFRDLRSKYQMEILIERIKQSKAGIDSVAFKEKELSCVYYPQYFAFVKDLDLSGNKLSCLKFLKCFPFLETVNLKGNNNLLKEDILDVKKWFCGTILV